jgi:hypothetical protein
LFGYLKKYPNQRLVLNSNSLLVDEELQQSSFHPDFLDDYDGAKEEIGTGFPDPYMVVMNWNLQYFLMPTSHAHHHLMRRSITGIMVFVGSTPVLWPSKHQGCIATSTYTTEFVTMRSALATSSTRGRRQFQFDICCVAWEFLLQNQPIFMATILVSFRVQLFRTVSSRRST